MRAYQAYLKKYSQVAQWRRVQGNDRTLALRSGTAQAISMDIDSLLPLNPWRGGHFIPNSISCHSREKGEKLCESTGHAPADKARAAKGPGLGVS
jgi:hypothetical protein